MKNTLTSISTDFNNLITNKISVDLSPAFREININPKKINELEIYNNNNVIYIKVVIDSLEYILVINLNKDYKNQRTRYSNKENWSILVCSPSENYIIRKKNSSTKKIPLIEYNQYTLYNGFFPSPKSDPTKKQLEQTLKALDNSKKTEKISYKRKKLYHRLKNLLFNLFKI